MMPTKPYWMVAGVCELVAVLLALAYVASDAWFGAGDIAAMIFWSVPFSLFTAAILRNIGRRIA